MYVCVSLPASSDGFDLDSGYQASPAESPPPAPPGEPAANYLQLVEPSDAAASQRTPGTYDYLQLVS